MTTELLRSARRLPTPVVSLRPLQLSDRERIRRWMADPAVIRFTVVVPGPEYAPLLPYSPYEADQYLSTLVHDPQRRSFAIEANGKHVGNVGLKELKPGKREAECFIELGEKAARGRGIGFAAMEQLLVYAFDDLALSRVRLGVFEYNLPALRLYRRLGFVDDGGFGWHFSEGRHWEVLAMKLDASDWRRRKTAAGP